MPGWTRRLIASWAHVGEYLIFLGVCAAGIANATLE